MKKMVNHFFNIIYPDLHPTSTADVNERKDLTSIAIAKDGEFVSICTKDGCAVFHSPQELRNLAAALYEAADLFENNQAGTKYQRIKS